MQIKVERGLLPQSHQKRSQALLEDCILDVQKNSAAAEHRVQACLSELSAEERPWVEGTLVATGVTENVDCRHILDVCVAAHLTDFSQTLWPADTSEAPEFHHHVISIAQSWLSKRTLDAEPDSLLDVAEVCELQPVTLSPQ